MKQMKSPTWEFSGESGELKWLASCVGVRFCVSVLGRTMSVCSLTALGLTAGDDKEP